MNLEHLKRAERESRIQRDWRQKQKQWCTCDKGWVNIRLVPVSREKQLITKSKEVHKSELYIEKRNSTWEREAGGGKCL